MRQFVTTFLIAVGVIVVVFGLAWGFMAIEDALGYTECRKLYGQEFKFDSSSNLCIAPNGDVKGME